VLTEVFGSVIVAAQDVEGVPIDLDVAANGHVAWSDWLVVVVNVLVLVSVQELALDDSGVLLGWLVDGDAVVGQVEGDDEAAVNVFRHSRVEAGCKSEDLLVIVDRLEEVSLGLVWDELVDVAESVFLVSDTVVGWNQGGDWLGWGWEGDLSNWEIVAVFLSVEFLGGSVDAFDFKDAAESIDVAFWGDFVTGEVVVANEGLSWLVNIEAVWKLLSAEEQGKGVAAIVRVVNLADLDSVVGQVVVDNVWEVLATGEEAEDTSVVVEELLLGGNFATTEGLLEELLHLWVSLRGNLDQRRGKVVDWALLRGGKLGTLASEELSRIVVTVINAHASAENGDVSANAEVSGQEWLLGAVLLDDHLALEEGTLWLSSVRDLRLSDHDRLVFEEVKDGHFANSVVLEATFDNALLEVGVES